MRTRTRCVAILAVLALAQNSDKIAKADTPPNLLVVIQPESQAFKSGGYAPFDVQITNVGASQVSTTMSYLWLNVLTAPENLPINPCVSHVEDTTQTTSTKRSPNSASEKKRNHDSISGYYPGSTDKSGVSINLASGQSMTVFAATDLSCPYYSLSPGTYPVTGWVVLYDHASLSETAVQSTNIAQVTLTSAQAGSSPPPSVPGGASSLSTPPAQPSSSISYLQQVLDTPTISLDFYLSYGQEDLMNGPESATLAKGGRFFLTSGASGGSAQYIEDGDVSGTFGTPALSDQWYGHYATWSDATGALTTSIIGDSYPTGYHELHIGPGGGPYYSLLVDFADLLDVDEQPVFGVAMQAFLSNSNLASGSFRSGTAVSNLQYQDPSGNYYPWQSPASADTDYPGFASSFSATQDDSVIFAQNSPVSVILPNVKSIRRKPFDRRLVHKPTTYRLADNSLKREVLESVSPLKPGNIRYDARSSAIDGMRLVRFAEIEEASRSHSNEISPNRQVWQIEMHMPRPMTISRRTFAAGTRVVYVVDAETNRLLRYTIYGPR